MEAEEAHRGAKDQSFEGLSLAEALPLAMERARRIQGYAREIGPSGRFLDAIIEADIKWAELATMQGDVVGMLNAYQALMGLKE